MTNTIPKKALVALPDFAGGLDGAASRPYLIVPPEQALVPAFDRSFHFGDSLYEVTRSYEGVLFSLDEHLRRLTRSCELAYFEILPDVDRIRSLVNETCRAFFNRFGNRDIYVRVVVSRGYGDLNIDRATASEPYSLVYVKELEPFSQKLYDTGMHYAVVPRRRNPPSALDPAMKSGNYLNNVLALVEAKRMGASDAILLSQQGFVTEGTTNNVHIVTAGEVWTAPLSVGILAGITRDWVFQLGRQEGIKVQERLYTESDIYSAQEMFLTSATKEVMPITTVSGRPIGDGKPGPVTRKLHVAMRKLIKDYTAKHKSESVYV
ncbi:MAG: aminotransferase class IV [Deltaproteobacteria bacterium]|nr:aminotransferase class IV [Deltaproteobacteria bacterium]